MEKPTLSTMPADEKLSFDRFRDEVLKDYRVACISRETSLLGRKEVLTGKAKFGIFGDGKEVAQVAMAKFFQPGDFRSGYYRDQTFAFAIGLTTAEQYFAQLYADPDINNDPFSAGRQMNAHFATPNTDANGEWLDLAGIKNTAADMAPTAGQMPRSLGLAYASRMFRKVEKLRSLNGLSQNGNEVCFATIGDSSTSEGHFWETINAAGVLQVPLAVFVWDNGYGISVPKKYQTTKGSISEILQGFQKTEGTNGLNIYKVKGWDYAGMCEAFEEGIGLARATHTPCVFHVEEITQPQGHSTSGSHERYKPTERLEWEREWDGIKKMKEWIIETGLADEEELNQLQDEAKDEVRNGKNKAWEKYQAPIKAQAARTIELINQLSNGLPDKSDEFRKIAAGLSANREPLRRDVMKALYVAIGVAGNHDAAFWIKDYYKDLQEENKAFFNSHLYNEGPKSTLNVAVMEAVYGQDAPLIN
ncbi:MAG: thiamine pyrophosphate-dependent dehydrogenase E1 component subunit alpha, partial [Chitinophagaceae bacterium]|nr:thiamine pyrophosphate-dependent dehydrogenase E1 component subunit alpha [Chitinophagaceae bacterium]